MYVVFVKFFVESIFKEVGRDVDGSNVVGIVKGVVVNVVLETSVDVFGELFNVEVVWDFVVKVFLLSLVVLVVEVVFKENFFVVIDSFVDVVMYFVWLLFSFEFLTISFSNFEFLIIPSIGNFVDFFIFGVLVCFFGNFWRYSCCI